MIKSLVDLFFIKWEMRLFGSGLGPGSIASRIVRDHNTSAPLFLYAAFQDNHAPNQCPEKYLSRFPELPAALSRQCCEYSHAIARALHSSSPI